MFFLASSLFVAEIVDKDTGELVKTVELSLNYNRG